MNQCATCGHTRRAHIYEEGACRPGFVCEAGCAQYLPTRDEGPTGIDEWERRAREAVEWGIVYENPEAILTLIEDVRRQRATLDAVRAVADDFQTRARDKPLRRRQCASRIYHALRTYDAYNDGP